MGQHLRSIIGRTSISFGIATTAPALLFCLTDLARLIDDSATQAELEYSIFNPLHKAMDEIDRRDRSMKAKFRGLEAEASLIRAEVDILVNQTRFELEI
jgi:hypothetical protein